MKIAIIGLGYWGKIILKNLRDLGLDKDLIVCESQDVDLSDIGSKYIVAKDYKTITCDKVFILTPTSTHFDLCKYFLKKGVDVFCEKPLCMKSEQCKELYDLAESTQAKLFTDWLFTFNPAVLELKKIIAILGKPKNIFANRLNFGPIRYDTNAKWDLASHDVSIACFLLDEFPNEIKWVNFKRNKSSFKEDSCIGVLLFKETCVQINTSWEYGIKDRIYKLEFEDRIITWDDSTKSLSQSKDDSLIKISNESPLHLSIKSFLFDKIDQKKLTLDVTKILEYEG